MASTKVSYSSLGLEWLKTKAEELKKYVEDRPFDMLEDRIVGDKVVATIEVQLKSLTQALKDYAMIIEQISKIEEREEKLTQKLRGDEQVGIIASEFLKKNKHSFDTE